MKFKREMGESGEGANPPPEAADRVDGGGPWGPTQFDLPERTGNTQAIVIVVLVGAAILLVLAVLWVLVYYRIT
jgi:hypothetical protein